MVFKSASMLKLAFETTETKYALLYNTISFSNLCSLQELSHFIVRQHNFSVYLLERQAIVKAIEYLYFSMTRSELFKREKASMMMMAFMCIHNDNFLSPQNISSVTKRANHGTALGFRSMGRIRVNLLLTIFNHLSPMPGR